MRIVELRIDGITRGFVIALLGLEGAIDTASFGSARPMRCGPLMRFVGILEFVFGNIERFLKRSMS